MSAFSVHDTNVISNVIVMSDDEFDTVDTPLANELVGSTENMQAV